MCSLVLNIIYSGCASLVLPSALPLFHPHPPLPRMPTSIWMPFAHIDPLSLKPSGYKGRGRVVADMGNTGFPVFFGQIVGVSWGRNFLALIANYWDNLEQGSFFVGRWYDGRALPLGARSNGTTLVVGNGCCRLSLALSTSFCRTSMAFFALLLSGVLVLLLLLYLFEIHCLCNGIFLWRHCSGTHLGSFVAIAVVPLGR